MNTDESTLTTRPETRRVCEDVALRTAEVTDAWNKGMDRLLDDILVLPLVLDDSFVPPSAEVHGLLDDDGDEWEFNNRVPRFEEE